jgi:membrane protease YdiL (CAAX protease family)
MDFNIRKPLHLFALILIIFSFIVVIGLPILSFFEILPSTQSEQFEDIAETINLFVEILAVIFQLVIAFIFFILIPILWYVMVNNCTFRETFRRLKLRLENIDIAFLWGIVATIGIYALAFAITFILQWLGFELTDLSNVPDLEMLFSPGALFILIALMPIAEEIFFRGFLLDKISSFAGDKFAIFATAVLFSIAHMTYAKLAPVLLILIMGIILGYIVVRTRNLFASIVAHMSYNIVVFILYFLAKSLI